MRLLQRLSTGLVLALVGVAAVMGWQALDQPVELVQITGALSPQERERAAEVISAQLPSGVLSLSVKRLRAQLRAESWIDEVSIWRQWPDGVRIEIEPQQAVARWRDAALLSDRGQVIQPLESLVEGDLPHLVGPEGGEVRVMSVYQRINARLRPHGLAVRQLEMHDDRTLQVELDTGARLMATEADLSAQLQRLEQLLERGLGERIEQVARLDMRYDNGVAVAWRSAADDDADSRHLAKGF